MKTRLILMTGSLLGLVLAGCENSTHTQREAGAGAAAGAVIGGIIGSQSGDAAEGAAVGAAAGGAIGAAHGSSKDTHAYSRDSDTYTAEDYRDLLTPEEVDILQARARAAGRDDERLTDFLTAQERENLRRRDRLQNHEIGN